MIRKVHEVDPFLCSQCGGMMKVISFLTDYAVVDRIIDHLKPFPDFPNNYRLPVALDIACHEK